MDKNLVQKNIDRIDSISTIYGTIAKCEAAVIATATCTMIEMAKMPINIVKATVLNGENPYTMLPENGYCK